LLALAALGIAQSAMLAMPPAAVAEVTEWNQADGVRLMESGTPSDNPLQKAQYNLDQDVTTIGGMVMLEDSPQLPHGYFRIKDWRDGGDNCLSTGGRIDTPATWLPCDGNSEIYYLTPSLRPGGYFVKPFGNPEHCLEDEPVLSQLHSGTPSPSPWVPLLANCADGQDQHDPLTTLGVANETASRLMWNFFPVRDGKAIENTQVDTIPLSDMANTGNDIHVCNWGAFVAYFVVDYTTTDSQGVDTEGHYKSKTLDVGQCDEVRPPNGYISGAITPILQMEGAGPWAATGVTTISGWNTDLTVHVDGNLCDSHAWTTARSRNSAVAMDQHPGTDCWRDTTKGVMVPVTAEEYILSMIPFLPSGDKSFKSSPESVFSGLGKNFGVKVPTASGNYYKNMYLIGWHATA